MGKELKNTRPIPNAASGEVDDGRAEEIIKRCFIALQASASDGNDVEVIRQAILEATKDLMEDKKRLDWLEEEVKFSPRISSFIFGKNLEGKWFLTEPHTKVLAMKCDTLRTAISTAMESK